MATEPSATPPVTPTAASAARGTRLDAIDRLRGVVMVIMALDHVRDYFSNVRFSPTDLTQTSVPLFLTRWITHFCAPVFVFLAGAAAFLSMARGKPRSELTRFLLTRGAWLVFLEVTVLRFAWYFNVDYPNVTLQVMWALGCSMIILAGLIHLPRWAIGAFGVLLIAGHDAFGGIGLQTHERVLFGAGARDWIVSILHVPRSPVLYPLIPWSGVMAAGYAFAPVFQKEPAARRRALYATGAALTAAFVLLRATRLYGDPSPWSAQPTAAFTVLSFVNTSKYPPSLLYLLMTLGPAIAAIPLLERAQGAVGRFFVTVGRVPLFYYIVHIYLIHVLALVAGVATGFPAAGFLSPFSRFPAGYGFGLPGVYAIWAFVVTALYLPCRWFAGVKARRKDAWLSYL